VVVACVIVARQRPDDGHVGERDGRWRTRTQRESRNTRRQPTT